MKRALIFAHYDKDNKVDDHVIFTLRNYRQYFQNIIFVTVSRLALGEVRKLHFLTDTVLLRDNIGYDFCSWKIGLAELDHYQYDEIVIANDSVYGPISDPAYLFESSRSSAADIWGASISEQIQTHIQSFFIVFKRTFLRTKDFSDFWKSVVPIQNKMDMITAYEIGLSAFARERGFTVDALVHLDSVSEEIRRICALENNMQYVLENAGLFPDHPLFEQKPNPMQLYWGHAFRCGMPFVKVEVMRDNPLNNNHSFIMESIKKGRIYDLQLIHNHLSRVGAKT